MEISFNKPGDYQQAFGLYWVWLHEVAEHNKSEEFYTYDRDTWEQINELYNKMTKEDQIKLYQIMPMFNIRLKLDK